MIEKKSVCQKKLAAPIMHLSSPTEGIFAKAITVSIQWQLMVHNEPCTSNLSRVIVKIISPFLPERPATPKHNYRKQKRDENACRTKKENHQHELYYPGCCAV